MERTDLTRARLAGLAYEPSQQKINKTLANWSLHTVDAVEHFLIPRTDTEGFAASIHDTLYIVCAGTDSKKDLMLDVAAWKDPYYYGVERVGKLHHGFYVAGNSIKSKIINIYESMFRPNRNIKNVEFIGHSLGGAVSLVAADIFLFHHCYVSPTKNHKPYSEQITTAGCPAGWSKAGADLYDQRHPNNIRLTNPFDMVTKVPILSYHAGFRKKLHGKCGHSINNYETNLSSENPI